MIRTRRGWRSAGLAVVLALAACGGGGGTVTPPAPVCGDGVVAGAEQCDDHGTAPGDGCSATCTLEAGWSCGGSPSTCATTCGDGVRAGVEQCDDHNTIAGDGCQPDCTPTPGAPQVITCAVLAPLPTATCQATAGDAGLLVTGTVLVPGTIYRGGQVAVGAAGTITCVGCDCSAAPGAATATRLTCPTGVVSPGLVNLHDHITYAQSAPFTDTGERYEHRHDWRVGRGGHTTITASSSASPDQVRWAELRFLLAGATSTAGAGGQAGLLRNLEVAGLREGLSSGPVHLDSFPLGDAGGAQPTSGCAYPAPASPAEWAAAPGALLTIGEGISAAGRNELVCTTGAGSGTGAADFTGPRAAFRNTLGATPDDLARLAATGTALVWSPRSNVALYGDTTPVAVAARLGVQVALGTDWAVTGSSTMLRELACADAWNRERLGGFFIDERLWLMATRDAADAAGLLGELGILAPGRAGDLAIFDGRTRTAHRAVLEATPAEVALVVRGGKVLTGDAAVVEVVRGAVACDAVDVCGRAKRVCLADEVGATYAALAAAAGAAPPAFACGAPPNEPTCTPVRQAGLPANVAPFYSGVPSAADADGDGIADATDNCPAVFNPIRPMDGGAQADADGDGVGDACDPCPLAANAAVCPAIDPNDPDGDGATTVADNCPTVSNADQADADGDGHGDACDACPAAANPGAQGCPATVYQVKDGTLPAGTPVVLSNLLVTGRTAAGFFVQVKPGDAGYTVADFSGLWVQAPGHAAAAGDRVTVAGSSATFFGQVQVAASAVTVLTSLGEAAPEPVVVAPAEVATGGARAAALEGVLVRVSGVAVTAVAPPLGAGDAAPSNEFVVDGTLRVDDLLHLASPFPAVGTAYASLTGILVFRTGDSKLEPRAGADLVGPQGLIGFGPAPAYVRVGGPAGPTIPSPLTVTLGGPAAADTFVAVTSGDAAVGVVGGGVTILAGQTAAQLQLTAAAQAASVTLTASLGGASLQVAVRALGAAEVAQAVALDPPSPVVATGGTVSFTATLDLPPAADQTLGISVAPAAGLTCPATATVPADQVRTTFDCAAPGAAGTATVTATLGASQVSATVTVSGSGAGLVINEVDYDSVGPDTAEFIEVYNPTGAAISLAGKALVLVNGGTGTEYGRIDLSAGGSLAAGQYLVVVPPGQAGAFPIGVLVILFAGAQDNMQNGPSDGVALVDTAAGTLLDALSYEGSILGATISGLTGTFDLAEGPATPAADGNAIPGSLSRFPNGVDTNNAAADWHLATLPTPGAANP